ncbi:hypothetical protein [Rosenbergiella australiborealis]|uniref:hypothetical protein n=1 Tax=Rosenbergiella australiborealis TaxID=1544696 RepID=UPI001F4DA558|nr:hypothetical protein [Rosenbergiella australiborealis]
MLSPLSSGSFNRPLGSEVATRAQPSPVATPSDVSARLSPSHRALRFPDELLISRDPQRFNTQLNQQITAVQRATDYLVETELSLRALAQPMNREKRQRQLRRMRQLVEQRVQQSGGTVDRNFQPCVDRPAQVIFSCEALQALLFTEQREIITFGLGEGTFRRWCSLLISTEMSLTQRIFALNRALGQFAIWCDYDLAQQRLLLTIPEHRWPELVNWSVRGSGGCFAADGLTLLRPIPVGCFEQQLQQLLSNEPTKVVLTAEQAVRHLMQERQKLLQQRQQVDHQLVQHSVTLDGQQALRLAQHTRQQLAVCRGEFRGLNQALQCQGNLPLLAVYQLIIGN